MSMTYCKRCDVHFDTDATEQADLCAHCERIVPDVSPDDVHLSMTIRNVPLIVGGVTVGWYGDLDVTARVDADNRIGGVEIKEFGGAGDVEIDRHGNAYTGGNATSPIDAWRGLAKAIFQAAQDEIDAGRHDCELSVARLEAGWDRQAMAGDRRREFYAV